MRVFRFSLPAFLLTLSLFTWTAVHAQITPLGDAYTNTASPTTNYGSKTLLDGEGSIPHQPPSRSPACNDPEKVG